MILNKIEYYKSEYIDADERGLSSHKDYYGKYIKKLNKMLEIL